MPGSHVRSPLRSRHDHEVRTVCLSRLLPARFHRAGPTPPAHDRHDRVALHRRHRRLRRQGRRPRHARVRRRGRRDDRSSRHLHDHERGRHPRHRRRRRGRDVLRLPQSQHHGLQDPHPHGGGEQRHLALHARLRSLRRCEQQRRLARSMAGQCQQRKRRRALLAPARASPRPRWPARGCRPARGAEPRTAAAGAAGARGAFR